MNLPIISVDYIDPYEGFEIETDKFLINLLDIIRPYMGSCINPSLKYSIQHEYKNLVMEYEIRNVEIEDITGMLDIERGEIVIDYSDTFDLEFDSREMLF